MKTLKIPLFLASISALAVIAFIISALLCSINSPGHLIDEITCPHVFFFFALTLLVELNYVLLPHGKTMSGSFGIILAAMLVFNGAVAVLIAVSSTLIIGAIQKSRPREPLIFRAAHYALVYSLGAIAMQLFIRYLPQFDGNDFPQMFSRAAIVLAIYLALHIPMNNLYLAMLHGLDKRIGWVEEELRQQTKSRHEIAGTILLFPIAVSMAHSYLVDRVFVIPLSLTIMCIITVRYISQLQVQRKLLGEAHLDELLEIYNRRYVLMRLTEEIDKAKRYGRPLSIILIDIDCFKKINDTHGHLNGDRVLRLVSNTIESCIRSSDCLARFGGDELLILMPETPLRSALTIASRISIEIEKQELSGKENSPIPITVSSGVASLPDGIAERTRETPSMLIDRADKALYRAKEEGRNLVRSELDIPGQTDRRKPARQEPENSGN